MPTPKTPKSTYNLLQNIDLRSKPLMVLNLRLGDNLNSPRGLSHLVISENHPSVSPLPEFL